MRASPQEPAYVEQDSKVRASPQVPAYCASDSKVRASIQEPAYGAPHSKAVPHHMSRPMAHRIQTRFASPYEPAYGAPHSKARASALPPNKIPPISKTAHMHMDPLPILGKIIEIINIL
jgi:hypothetical protein